MGRSAIAVPVIVGRAIVGRAPMVITMAPIGVAVPSVRGAEAEAHAPTVPGVVAYRKSIGIVVVVVVASVPGIVIVPCTINDRRAIHVRTIIPGCVAYIYHGWGGFVDIHIFGIVLRVFRGDFLYFFGPLICYLPWSVGGGGFEPNRIVTEVIGIFVLEYGTFRVHCILQFQAFHIFKLGLAIVLHCTGLGVSLYGSRLWDLCIIDRTFCFRRSRYIAQDIGFFAVAGNVFKILGQILRWDIGPVRL